MKKLFAMLLALCMMCGVVSAGAETVVLGEVQFDFPEDVRSSHTDQVAHFYSDDYEALVILFVERGIRFASSEEYFQDSRDFFVNQVQAEGGTAVISVPDWSSGTVICCCVEETGYYIFVKDYGDYWIRMNIEPGEHGFIDYEYANFLAERVFQTMSKKQRETITFGRASIEVDENTDVTQKDEYTWRLENTLDQYLVNFYFVDYEDDDIETMTNGDMQIDNCFVMNYFISGSEIAAINVCNQVQRMNIGMPGGDDVLYYSVNGITMLTYYYPNMGFAMMAQSFNPNLNDVELMEICKDIALSFRVDGMTVEEMDTYKEKTMADLKAAWTAAAEAQAASIPETIGYIVITDGANIRTAPDGNATKIKTAYAGEVYPLLGEEGTWYKIEVDGQVGYVVKGLAKIK